MWTLLSFLLCSRFLSCACLLQSEPVSIQREIGNYSARFYLIVSDAILQAQEMQELVVENGRSCMVECMLNNQCNCFGVLRSKNRTSACRLYKHELSSDASEFTRSPGWDFYSTGKIKLHYCRPAMSTFCVHYKTCEEAFDLGVPSESKVLIKPSFSTRPLIVTCRKQGTFWSNITVFHHNNEGTVKVQGTSYRRNFTYENEIEDILNAVDHSNDCAQYTELKCYISKLDPLSLYARNKTRLFYWGGGPSTGKGCACGLKGSCTVRSNPCNCYASFVTSADTDFGYITEKQHLPLTGIELSPSLGVTGYLNYIISSLYCIGMK